MAPTVRDSTVLIPAPAEDLCLGFANTRYWRGSDPATESLAAPKDLGDWLAANAVLSGSRNRSLKGGDLDALFDDALALREVIYRIFLAVGDGEPPPARDLEAFNRALAETPQRLGISARGDAYCWIAAESSAALGNMLAPVIWSAADLLTHVADRRIRRCANDRCRWVFVDRSKGGTRRWCDMSSCGNRAKSHRHYARSKRA